MTEYHIIIAAVCLLVSEKNPGFPAYDQYYGIYKINRLYFGCIVSRQILKIML